MSSESSVHAAWLRCLSTALWQRYGARGGTGMMHASRRPTLSVALFTYNHEPYIRQALDRVLGQRA